MKHSSYPLLLLISLVIALGACSSNRKKARLAEQESWSPVLSQAENRGSTGVWTCARYNDAATAATAAWGAAQMVQEYMQGYVTGYIEGQGRNLPQDQANIEQIRHQLDAGCARGPNYTIQQIAENASQIMYRQLQGIRLRRPVTMAGTTGGVECSNYIEGKVSSDPAFGIVRHAAQNWVDGYVTAVLTSAHRVFEPNTNKARVLQALDRTCSDNPRLTIQDAAEMVAKPLIATASRRHLQRPGQEEETSSRWGNVLE
jgi:hypothetical protein